MKKKRNKLDDLGWGNKRIGSFLFIWARGTFKINHPKFFVWISLSWDFLDLYISDMKENIESNKEKGKIKEWERGDWKLEIRPDRSVYIWSKYRILHFYFSFSHVHINLSKRDFEREARYEEIRAGLDNPNTSMDDYTKLTDYWFKGGKRPNVK